MSTKTLNQNTETVDENAFFRNATLRICGNLETDKALRAFLLYIRAFIPADFMGFLFYLPNEESFETIAVANLNESNTLSIKIPVPEIFRHRLKENFFEPRITIGIKNSMDDATQNMIRQLHWPEGNSLSIEMVLAGRRMGALTIINEQERRYTEEHARLLTLLNEPLGIALTNCLRYRKVRALKNILSEDKRYLEDELYQISTQQIIGAEQGLKPVIVLATQVAPLSSPVLLLGETGVGKEVIAKTLHNHSPRINNAFVKVNCGAITDSLIDSVLFGHEKGAFTGAVTQKRGCFERADKGTIFLDEIGELPLEVQVRLLRVLQDKEFERVGGEKNIKVDCRIIAATHQDLDQMIRSGRFREDLYFRLKVFPIRIPPLRERKNDIPALVQHFIRKKGREIAIKELPSLAPSALNDLMAYDWPGNVRELENAVERALIVSQGNSLVFSELHSDPLMNAPDTLSNPRGPAVFQPLDQIVKTHIYEALDIADGRVEGAGGAAELLGLHPATLRHRMRKLGIPFGRKRKRDASQT